MTDRSRTTGDARSQDDQSQDATTDGFRRREFVALGAGATTTMLAGCSGDGGLTSDGTDGSGGSDGSDGSDGSQTLTGNFRLLISDAPADIGDFDQLNVTLDEARIFEASEEGDDEEDDEQEETEEDEEDDTEEADEDDESDQTGNETDDQSDPANGTADEEDDGDTDEDDEDGDDDEDDDGDDDEGDEDDRGFTVVALDGATVDLTQVIEDDAIAVFDGEIPAGSYEKIELSVTTVEGIVDGEEVDVKLPSEKLQITNGFEVTPDEPVSFVFDINVVKRGPNNGYILQPVISGSGVAGRDVDVNEIDDEDEEDEDEDEDEDDEDDDSDDGDDGSDGDDTDDDSTTGGNETDDGSSDAENGTATNETGS